MKIKGLTKEGKEELALAIILLRDFKSAGEFDSDLVVQMIKFAEYLGVGQEYGELQSKIPPMKIEPRY